MRKILLAGVMGACIASPALAQLPCYTAVQCAGIRYQAEQAQAAQAAQARAEQEARAALAAAAEREQQQAAQRSRQAAEQARAAVAARVAAQMAAEDSPDNYCKNRAIARRILEAFNDMVTNRNSSLRIVDIEHLTTVQYDGPDMVVCHGSFVTTSARRLVGTLSIRPNVAGELISVWHPDR